jgi:hypothetical protein
MKQKFTDICKKYHIQRAITLDFATLAFFSMEQIHAPDDDIMLFRLWVRMC